MCIARGFVDFTMCWGNLFKGGSYFGEEGVEMKNLSLQKFTKSNSKKLHFYNTSYWPHLILGPLWTFSTLNIRVLIIPLSQPIRMKRWTTYSESLFHIGPHRGPFLIGQSSKKNIVRIYGGGPFTSKLENLSETAFPRHPIYKMI